MKVSKLAHTIRTELMMEHWGLPYEAVVDPYTNAESLTDIALSNSRIYFEIF